MSTAGALLLLLGTVVAVDGERLTVEGELLQALAPGDRGAVFYELEVGSERRRIEVGAAEVVGAAPGTAVLKLASAGVAARPGYRAEFRVPAARMLAGPGPPRPPIADDERMELARQLETLRQERAELERRVELLELAAEQGTEGLRTRIEALEWALGELYRRQRGGL